MKKTGSFSATGTDSRQYTVYIYTDLIDAGDFVNPNAIADGLMELRTSGGMHLKRLQQGEYEILETGVVLRSSSPVAP
jgi:hypothetical protein